MRVTPRARYVSPECRTSEHKHCHGPGTVTVPGVCTPVIHLHCACQCHTPPADPPQPDPP